MKNACSIHKIKIFKKASEVLAPYRIGFNIGNISFCFISYLPYMSILCSAYLIFWYIDFSSSCFLSLGGFFIKLCLSFFKFFLTLCISVAQGKFLPEKCCIIAAGYSCNSTNFHITLLT